MTAYNISIHRPEGVRLVEHYKHNGTEWIVIKIGDMKLTIYGRAAIDDALHLPRDPDFSTNIDATE